MKTEYRKTLTKLVNDHQGRRHLGSRGGNAHPPLPPTFLRSKNKKGRQREKRKDFKAETIKRLSLRSKYFCFNHSRASRIRKFFLSANHGGRQCFSLFHATPYNKSFWKYVKPLFTDKKPRYNNITLVKNDSIVHVFFI